jgi:hypothetical protein
METEEEPFDFKPFFDMVVGVLFILIILVAAQIFFARQDAADEAARDARQAGEQRRWLAETEIAEFLRRQAAALASRGFETTVQRNNQTLVLRLDPARLDAAPGAVAEALLAEAGCAVESHRRRDGCAHYDHIRLQHIEMTLETAPAPGADPEAEAARRAVSFAAGLARAGADLLALKAADGRMILPPHFVAGRSRPPATPPEGQAFLQLRFALPSVN